jgi:predicted RND superfamily exporter protein
MTQLSKVLKSRDEWRSKAIRRGDELREQRKADRRHRDSIAELKSEVESLKQSSNANAKKKI